MQIALSTVCLTHLDWRENLAAAAGAGYQNVELLAIQGWKHVDATTIPAAELLAEAQRTGIRIIGLHAGALDGLDDTTIAATEQYVHRTLQLAHALGVPLVNVNGGRMPKEPTDRQPMLQRIAVSLRRLAPVLEQLGLRLTLENHYGFQIEQPADYDGLLVSPRIGVTVDTGHFTAAKVDMPALIRRLGQRVFHVHIKDHIGTQSVALGDGQTDNAGVIAALREIGYSGHLSVELELHDPSARQPAIAAALPYLRRLLT
jgi:sugar phosphate isomerase/epimerase